MTKNEDRCGKKSKGKHDSKEGPSKNKKGCNPGRVTRNPFLNFLRKYRVQHCDWPTVKIAVEGAKVWNKLPDAEKGKYRKEAATAPKVPRKRRKHRAGTLEKKQKRRQQRVKVGKHDGYSKKKEVEKKQDGCKKKKEGEGKHVVCKKKNFIKQIVEMVLNALRCQKKRKKKKC